MLDKDGKRQLAPAEDHRGYDNIALEESRSDSPVDEVDKSASENRSLILQRRRKANDPECRADRDGERVAITVGVSEDCRKETIANGDGSVLADSGDEEVGSDCVGHPTFNISDDRDLSDKGTVSSADADASGRENEEQQVHRNSHYLANGNGKILNCTNEMEIPIPDDAVINYNTGRVRAKKKNASKTQDSFSEEKIPIEQVEMNVAIVHDTSDKAREAHTLYNESYAQNGGHLVDGEVKTISVGIPVASPLTSEKLVQQTNGKPFEEYFIPANTHKKFLRGEKLYLTKDKRTACTSWRRVIMCGVIIIIVAIAILVGALAATGILLAERNATQRSYPVEIISELPESASISGNAPSFTNAISQTSTTRSSSEPPPAKPSVIIPLPDATTVFTPDLSVPDMPPVVNEINETVPVFVVPNAVAGEFKILNLEFSDVLYDNSSDKYARLAKELEQELKKLFQERNLNVTSVKIRGFRPGTVTTSFVAIWEAEEGAITENKIASEFRGWLAKNNYLLAKRYLIDPNSIKIRAVINECDVRNGGCSHNCSWSFATLTRMCSCPSGKRLKEDQKTCMSDKSGWTTPISPITAFTFSSSRPNSPSADPTPVEIETHPSNNISETVRTHPSSTEEFVPQTTTTVESNDARSTADELLMNFESTTGEHNALTSLPPFFETETVDSNDVNYGNTTRNLPNETTTERNDINGTRDVDFPAETTRGFTDEAIPFETDKDVTSALPRTNAPNDSDILTSDWPFQTDTADNTSISTAPALETTTLVTTTTVTAISQTNQEIPVVEVMGNSTSTNAPEMEEPTTLPSVTATDEVDDIIVHSVTATEEAQTEVYPIPPVLTDIPTTNSSSTTTVTSEIEASTEPEQIKELSPSTTTSVKMPNASKDVTTISYNEVVTEAHTLPSAPSEGAGMPDIETTTITHLSTLAPNREPGMTTVSPALDTTVVLMETEDSTINDGIHNRSDNLLTEVPPISPDVTEVSKSFTETTTMPMSSTNMEITTQTFSEEIPLKGVDDVENITTTRPTSTELQLTQFNTTIDRDDTTGIPVQNSTESNEFESTTAFMDTNTHSSTVSYDTTLPGIQVTTVSSETTTQDYNQSFTDLPIPASESVTDRPADVDASSEVPITTIASTDNEAISDGTESFPNSFANQTEDSTNANATEPTGESVSTVAVTETENGTSTEASIADAKQPVTSSDDVNSTEVASLTESVTTALTTSEIATLSPAWIDLNITDDGNVTDAEVDNATILFDNATSANLSNATEAENSTSISTLDYPNATEAVTHGCSPEEFTCPDDTTCRANTLLCDGIRDCQDSGYDESNCEESCNLNFRCDNSTCIMSKAHCDGIYDCEDGSDEISCRPSECGEHEVLCKDFSACLKPLDICDNNYNCADRSDEAGCTERTTCEAIGKFYCAEGLCIPLSLRCDGHDDCRSREDEANCTCESNNFQCLNGFCTPETTRCNGKKDCDDSSDEMGCLRVDSEGTVQVYDSGNNTWALLCNQNWNMDEANRVCQELGFSGAAFSSSIDIVPNVTSWAVRTNSSANESASPFWTDGLLFTDTCTPFKAASVKCQMFDCGTKKHSLSRRRKRIVDGPKTQPAQWPSLAMVYTLQSGTQGCHAVILTPLWLVSSAACIDKLSGPESSWYVRVNNDGEQKEGSGLYQKKRARKPFVHPHSSKFRSPILRDYDIALIRLEAPLDLNTAQLDAICLPADEVRGGITCFAGSFGSKQPRVPPEDEPAEVSYLDLQILDRIQCNQENHYNGTVNNRMLCTHSKGVRRNLCDNDDGSPLMCLSPKEKWYLAGLLTYQRLCNAYYQQPAVFSNLFSMLDFVHKVTGQTFYDVPYDSMLYTRQEFAETTTTEITTFSTALETNATTATEFDAETTKSFEETTVSMQEPTNETEPKILLGEQGDLHQEMATVIPEIMTTIPSTNIEAPTLAEQADAPASPETSTTSSLNENVDYVNLTSKLPSEFELLNATETENETLLPISSTSLAASGTVTSDESTLGSNATSLTEKYVLTTEEADTSFGNVDTAKAVENVTVENDTDATTANLVAESEYGSEQADLQVPAPESTTELSEINTSMPALTTPSDLPESVITTVESAPEVNTGFTNAPDAMQPQGLLPKSADSNVEEPFSTSVIGIVTPAPIQTTPVPEILGRAESDNGMSSLVVTAQSTEFYIDAMINDAPVSNAEEAGKISKSLEETADQVDNYEAKSMANDSIEDKSSKNFQILNASMSTVTEDTLNDATNTVSSINSELLHTTEQAETLTTTKSPLNKDTDEIFTSQDHISVLPEEHASQRLRVTADSVFDMTTISAAMLDRIVKHAKMSSLPNDPGSNSEEVLMTDANISMPAEAPSLPESLGDKEECLSGVICNIGSVSKCIPPNKICDKENDCVDGSDELNCDCKDNEYKCDNGGCVPEDGLCDGIANCPDGSDEWNCIRLLNDTGLVEVYHSREGWLPVCADAWNDQWSDAVCRQLGFSTAQMTTEMQMQASVISDAEASSKYFFLNSSENQRSRSTIPLRKYLEVRISGECTKESTVAVACEKYFCGSWSLVNLESPASERINKWPASVGILRDKESQHSCTATIVSPLWVITSLECLRLRDPSLTHPWIFTRSTSDNSKSSVQTIEAEQLVAHPSAKSFKNISRHDFALVRLRESLRLNADYVPICLPRNELEPKLTKCVAAKWSNVNETEGNKENAKYLSTFNLPKDECNETVRQEGLRSESVVCAKHGSCEVRSGDPLMCVNELGQWELQGVLPSPVQCLSSSSSPTLLFNGVYAASYWIKAVVGDSVLSSREVE